ncbi:hypothetical protein E4Z66_08760 [Aliishimia ponticola]|uniref:Copper chaperone PCu(A)C n=1 Tax=Aliishimia ponticola TaxID=2499833 RepID=A0A4S4NCC1_9RHOB|nr:hypothetical protein [Aliishimia ponticola]THH37019.1 hypothetical protein E4Z66_08760 [Aliishimia ponticola]
MKAARWLFLLALLGVAGWLLVAERGPAILVTDALVVPFEGGAAGLVSIDNPGPPDRLVAVSSTATTAVLYVPTDQTSLPIPTGSSALALDAAHIRLGGSFADGTLIPLTLSFAQAGDVTLQARLSDPTTQGGAEEVGLFGLGDICKVGEGEPAPAISLDVTPEPDGWHIDIKAEDFTFSKDLVGLYHVPGVGHGHIYVGGMKLGRLYAPEAHIGALPKGRHEVRVTLNTNDHRAYVVGDTPVTATAVIVVD